MSYWPPLVYLQTLILAPTRELAKQVHDDIQSITSRLSLTCIYGGTSYDKQGKSGETLAAIFFTQTNGTLMDPLALSNQWAVHVELWWFLYCEPAQTVNSGGKVAVIVFNFPILVISILAISCNIVPRGMPKDLINGK